VGGCCGAVAVRPRPARAQTDAGEARDVDQADQFAATIAAAGEVFDVGQLAAADR